MRIALGVLCCVCFLAGCANPKSLTTKPQPHQNTPVTPDFRISGEVKVVNLQVGYVIANFPVTHLPRIGQRLDVYRDGQKVGEIKISGPQPLNGNVPADIIAGSVQIGDEVRE